MSKRTIEIFDGEYYTDMSKKPQKTIWQAAVVNNKKRKIVRRHDCRDDSYFSSL